MSEVLGSIIGGLTVSLISRFVINNPTVNNYFTSKCCSGDKKNEDEEVVNHDKDTNHSQGLGAVSVDIDSNSNNSTEHIHHHG